MATQENIEIILNAKDLLEIAYHLSGVVIMVIAGFGLWQLKLAKDQVSLAKDQIQTSKEIFKTQSKRSSIEASVIECRRFSEEVIQLSLKIDDLFEKEGITFFNDAILTKNNNSVSINLKPVNKEDFEKIGQHSPLLNQYLNGMEAFALFFLSGVADENIAFHTNGKVFLEECERAFKLFAAGNVEDDDAELVKKLYFMWDKKLQAKKLKIQKKEIDGKLAEYKEPNIKAIGT